MTSLKFSIRFGMWFLGICALGYIFATSSIFVYFDTLQYTFGMLWYPASINPLFGLIEAICLFGVGFVLGEIIYPFVEK